MTQLELLDHLIRLEDGKEYTAVQLTDKIKGYYKNKPFYAMNDTKTTKDRIYYCDFNPRKKYMYNGKWHIDHKIPCASFDLRKVSEQKKCFNYKNLQPMWAIDNLRKGTKLI